jgi:hypothetical protein
VLSIDDGLQLPVTPLFDVVGNDGKGSPAQIVIEPGKENDGFASAFTVTSNVTGTAHCPASGVNV